MATDKHLDIDFLRATGAKPAWFGLGFVQLKLNDTERMHFWHPAASPDVPEEEVHDHRYGFKSCILLGAIMHEYWLFKSDPDGDAEMFEVSCKPGIPTDPTPLAVGRMVMSGRIKLERGSEYSLPASQFHRIVASRAVTLLKRGPVVKDKARVVHPRGAPTVCAFSAPKPEAECWDLIADLLTGGGHG